MYIVAVLLYILAISVMLYKCYKCIFNCSNNLFSSNV